MAPDVDLREQGHATIEDGGNDRGTLNCPGETCHNSGYIC